MMLFGLCQIIPLYICSTLLVAVQSKSILPITSILSSSTTFPTLRYNILPKSSSSSSSSPGISVSSSSNNNDVNYSNNDNIDASSTSSSSIPYQQDFRDAKQAATTTSSSIESIVRSNILSDDEIDDINAAAVIAEVEEEEENDEKDTIAPVVSIITTTTTTTLDVNGSRNNDKSIAVSILTPPVSTTTTTIAPIITTTTTTTTKNTIFICILAVLSGFGEICSLKSFGCFTNMVTGATIRLAMSISDGHYHATRIPLCVITGYLSGVILGRILKYKVDTTTIAADMEQQTFIDGQKKVSKKIVLPRHERNPSSDLLLLVASIVLPMFTIPELLKIVQRRSIITPIPLQTLLQGVGYGLVAQVMTDVLATPTTVYVVTGHFTAISKLISDRCLQFLNKNKSSGSSASSIKPSPQQRLSIQIIISFIVGAMIASWMYQYCTFLLPFQHSITGILLVLTLVWYSNQLHNKVVSK